VVQVPAVPEYPSYLPQLTRILAEALIPKPIPFLRRRDIEALFGLKKRQAVNLMHRIGAIRVSRELAVDQQDLVRWLEQRIADPATVMEQRRQERVIDRIIELKAETAARAVKIVLPSLTPPEDLPEGVSLQPGLLSVAFESEEQFLERLFLLARLLASQPEILGSVHLPR
jgi:hypothetical protein